MNHSLLFKRFSKKIPEEKLFFIFNKEEKGINEEDIIIRLKNLDKKLKEQVKNEKLEVKE